MKFLVADDTEMNLALAAKLLTRKGHQVVTAEDGLQAYEAFCKERFDAVLMDVQMPGMDGLEATRKIRLWEQERLQTNPPEEAGPRVPVIALTANDEPRLLKVYMEAGMDGMITKPFEIQTLIPTIESIMDQAKSR